ncbi:type VI secretion system protein TssL, long form [Azospirillum brasilense]|uniref:type VI secretion system protein TssL, long form n=1 Tax=Azospirillum brasilense TaxID=192 RepID=UPI0013B37506|nr:type VI secretion system protein TssL, long form [Azospirillum brasilense]
MNGDDPFNPSDRTVIRPNPGGRRPAAPQAAPASGWPQQPVASGTFPPPSFPPDAAPGRAGPAATAEAGRGPVPGVGRPVAAAATGILLMVSKVRTMVAPPDVERLRGLMTEEIRAFEQRLLALGLPGDLVRHAHYVVCATVDDLVLNTPWGGNSLWARQGMVGTFHRETVGGERFFDNLAQLKADPGRNAGVLELMYLCLSLGFQGHMRIAPRGSEEIARLREDLHRLLRRGGPDDGLSPHWMGVREPARRLSAIVPLWVIGAVAGALLLLAYVGFSFALSGSSDSLFGRLAALPQRGVVLIARPPLPPPTIPDRHQQAPRIKKFLEREIAEGLVTVTETMDSIVVRIRNRGLFASASATVEAPFLPTIERIAQALEGEKGKVTIVGHTDNQPIRSVRFPSNWNLSVARADAVAALIGRSLSDKTRIKTIGKADSDPVAGNDTPEGREQNRRIDVVLSKADGA